MEYSFQKTYQLKQQTPYIHFQHAQKSATLRATEVKPKLDRFILETYKKNNGGQDVPSGWYIDKSKSQALNYKMKFIASGEPIKSQTIEEEKIQFLHRIHHEQRAVTGYRLINGMYFGNMVEDRRERNETERINNYNRSVEEKFKESVFYTQPIELVITCFIEDLRNEIDRLIEDFFLLENFGTRQSKGFGGYTVIKKTEDNTWQPRSPKNLLDFYQSQGKPFFYATEQRSASSPNQAELADKMLNHAMTVYAVMKGGINRTGWNGDRYRDKQQYIKGYIQRRYFDDQRRPNFRSEKVFIKSKRIVPPYNCPVGREAGEDLRQDETPLFIRALLGLPDFYTYRYVKDRDADYGGSKTVYMISEGDGKPAINRFPSPVTIKIIDNYLFFLFGSFDEILGKKFFISRQSLSSNNENYEQLKRESKRNQWVISTPNVEQFDLNGFIDGFIGYFNSSQVKYALSRMPSMHKYSQELNLLRGDQHGR